MTAPISLRPLRSADAPAIVAACRDAPDISTYVMRLPSLDVPAAQEWIEQRIERERTSEQITRAIVGTDDVLIGAIWLGRFDSEARRGELAYWVAPHARGRGVATAAVRAMAAWGFRSLNLIRVQILAPVDHPASRAVATAAGFTEEGTLRLYRRISGTHSDMVVLSLLASEV